MKLTAGFPVARCIVRGCTIAERNLAALDTSLERPRKQLSACRWSAAARTHEACHELMEHGQLGKFRPQALRLVVALAGRDEATSLRDPEHFTQRLPRGANVDQHLVTDCDIERLVGKGEFVDTALLKLDVFDAGRFGDSSRPWQDAGVEVDAGNVAVGDELGETHRDGA